jgi:hypothetical protein
MEWNEIKRKGSFAFLFSEDFFVFVAKRARIAIVNSTTNKQERRKNKTHRKEILDPTTYGNCGVIDMQYTIILCRYMQ